MRLQHVVHHQLGRLFHRYALLRRISTITTVLTLLWVYVIYWGERTVYTDHAQSCKWETWEQWPPEATPHHLVFIADPQLVDPHTYPGRPWPLSTITERYTDRYMSRNFRLLNAHLDPDSIVFLGDLFDGGREWGPDKARQLKTTQRQRMEDLGVLPSKEKKGAPTQKKTKDTTEQKTKEKTKRDLESFKGDITDEHLNIVSKVEPKVEVNEEELKGFIPGENGRWSRWGGRQWAHDYDRFSKIFFAPEQLYPQSQRELFAAYDVTADPTSIDNGAKEGAWQEYATSGSKSRQVIASLPGNHDVGFGAGVQLVVRDRFQSYFGNSNRIDIIGNHTVISVDTPSLSAHNQYLSTGYESESEQFLPLKHIWKPSMEFVNHLYVPAGKAVSEALAKYYPKERKGGIWTHEVTDSDDRKASSANKISPEEALKPKPQLPVILLSHVPFYRNPGSDCGPHREKGRAISVQFGYQYQNVLTQTLSRDLVSKVSTVGEIVTIFSGDDHDYCDFPHNYNVAIGEDYDPVNSVKTQMMRVREVTVKSFSWAMGVRKPAFQLVSLWNPVDVDGDTIGTPLPTVQTHPCLLPDQLSIFIDYALLLMLTLPVLLVRAIILTLRSVPESPSFDDMPLTPTRTTFTRFQAKLNGSATKGRPRGDSASTSSHSRHNSNLSNNFLGVQRSHNARTRSVSPTYGGGSSQQQTIGSLVDNAGYYPQVRWTDPADDDSDEESNVAWEDTGGSQAKWKWRRRAPGRVRKSLDEFGVSLLIVGVPCTVWYFFLIRNG